MLKDGYKWLTVFCCALLLLINSNVEAKLFNLSFPISENLLNQKIISDLGNASYCYSSTGNSKAYTFLYTTVCSVNQNVISNKKKVWLWLVLILVFDVTVLIVFIYRKRKAKNSQLNAEPDVEKNDNSELKENTLSTNQKQYSNSILLFGNFQFFQSEGVEISNKFSPLLKELFLMILLHSSNKNRGIPTSNLIENLWPDMLEKNARNNLAVNIGKLRAILGPDFHELLINQSGTWKFNIDDNQGILYCDYYKCLNILEFKNEYTFNDVQLLISIIQKGGLLVDLSYVWLDIFKANISNSIIDRLLAFASNNKTNISADFVIKIADTVMLFDMVNENAMELKCKALVSLGKHGIANDTYTKFIKEYKILYDVDYNRSFKSITG